MHSAVEFHTTWSDLRDPPPEMSRALMEYYRAFRHRGAELTVTFHLRPPERIKVELLHGQAGLVRVRWEGQLSFSKGTEAEIGQELCDELGLRRPLHGPWQHPQETVATVLRHAPRLGTSGLGYGVGGKRSGRFLGDIESGRLVRSLLTSLATFRWDRLLLLRADALNVGWDLPCVSIARALCREGLTDAALCAAFARGMAFLPLGSLPIPAGRAAGAALAARVSTFALDSFRKGLGDAYDELVDDTGGMLIRLPVWSAWPQAKRAFYNAVAVARHRLQESGAEAATGAVMRCFWYLGALLEDPGLYRGDPLEAMTKYALPRSGRGSR